MIAFNHRTDVFHVACGICGQEYKIFLDEDDYDKWQRNECYIQDCLAYLTTAERELLISGTCDICWQKMYPNDNDFKTE